MGTTHKLNRLNSTKDNQARNEAIKRPAAYIPSGMTPNGVARILSLYLNEFEADKLPYVCEGEQMSPFDECLYQAFKTEKYIPKTSTGISSSLLDKY